MTLHREGKTYFTSSGDVAYTSDLTQTRENKEK